MAISPRNSIAGFGLWGVSLGVCLLLLACLPAWAALAAGSTCLECHEVQGEDPVSALGSWHLQHASGDLCGVCHAGQPLAADKNAAHQGMRLNPMDKPEASCAICHPSDYAGNVESYSAELQLTKTMQPPTPPEPTSTSTATFTPAAVQPGAAMTQTLPAPGAAASSTPVPPPMTATSTPQPAPVEAPPAGFNWLGLLALARGPLFKAALWFFSVGMLLRLALVLRHGWRHRRPPVKSGGAALGARNLLASFGRGLLVLPFFPWLKSAWRRSRVTYIAGGLFHLGLLVIIFLSRAHILVWKELISLDWPALPRPLVGWFSALTLLALLVLLVHRTVNPVLRLLSGLGEWLNWLLVFLPVLSGYILARQWWLPYEAAYALHMLLVDLLLVWIPLSRISHFMFYFISRGIHGLEYGKRSLVR